MIWLLMKGCRADKIEERNSFYLFIYFIVFSGCDSPLEVFYKLINSWNVFFHILLKINDLYIVENFYLLTIVFVKI